MNKFYSDFNRCMFNNGLISLNSFKGNVRNSRYVHIYLIASFCFQRNTREVWRQIFADTIYFYLKLSPLWDMTLYLKCWVLFQLLLFTSIYSEYSSSDVAIEQGDSHWIFFCFSLNSKQTVLISIFTSKPNRASSLC